MPKNRNHFYVSFDSFQSIAHVSCSVHITIHNTHCHSQSMWLGARYPSKTQASWRNTPLLLLMCPVMWRVSLGLHTHGLCPVPPSILPRGVDYCLRMVEAAELNKLILRYEPRHVEYTDELSSQFTNHSFRLSSNESLMKQKAKRLTWMCWRRNRSMVWGIEKEVTKHHGTHLQRA